MRTTTDTLHEFMEHYAPLITSGLPTTLDDAIQELTEHRRVILGMFHILTGLTSLGDFVIPLTTAEERLYEVYELVKHDAL